MAVTLTAILSDTFGNEIRRYFVETEDYSRFLFAPDWWDGSQLSHREARLRRRRQRNGSFRKVWWAR